MSFSGDTLKLLAGLAVVVLAPAFLINAWDLWGRKRFARWFGIKTAPESGPERAERVRLKTKARVEQWAIIRKKGKLRYILTETLLSINGLFKMRILLINSIGLLILSLSLSYFPLHSPPTQVLEVLIINVFFRMLGNWASWSDNEQEFQRYEERYRLTPDRAMPGKPQNQASL